MSTNSTPENPTSPCCGVTIELHRGGGGTMGSCSKCGVAIIRVNPQTGAQEWLDGQSPWHPGDLRPVVPTLCETTLHLCGCVESCRGVATLDAGVRCSMSLSGSEMVVAMKQWWDQNKDLEKVAAYLAAHPVPREVPEPAPKPPHTYCGLCSNPLGGAWYMDLETPGHIVIPAMCISCRAHLFTRQGLTSTVDELSTRAGCPCELVAPCSEHCSCANGVMSGGCSRCCRYGSDEQQLAAAARLADLAGEVERYRAGVEGLKKMAHCEAGETVAALGLIRLAAREILLGVGLIEHDSGEGSS